MDAVKGLENKKWDFSKEEEYAIGWLLENGFEVELKEQFVSKTKFFVRKDGVLDSFDLTQGLKKMNIRSYMEQYGKQFEMLRRIKEKAAS